MNNLSEEFESKGPWITKFVIDGESYGGDFDAMNDVRVEQFFECFPNSKRILELGSLEGGHSFALARNPLVEEVIAVELRDQNVSRAKFVQQVLGDRKVKFVHADVLEYDFAEQGEFDAIFCSGLLYHLREPWKLIEKIGKATANTFLWTHYACENEAKKFSGGFRGRWYKEHGWLDPLSGGAKHSFWLSMGSLVNLLNANGFNRINLLENNLTHRSGCSITLAAAKHEPH